MYPVVRSAMLCGRMTTFMPVLPWTWRPRWRRAPRADRRYGWRARARAAHRAAATRPGPAPHARPRAPRTPRRGRAGAASRRASCDPLERGRAHQRVVERGLDARRIVAAEIGEHMLVRPEQDAGAGEGAVALGGDPVARQRNHDPLSLSPRQSAGVRVEPEQREPAQLVQQPPFVQRRV